MSAASLLATPDPASTLITAVRDTVVRVFPADLRAVVLTGSLARGEGTWLRDPARVRLAGDAEFFIIFEDGTPLPAADRVAALREEIERQLRARRIEAKIGLSPVGPDYLRRLQPHIFAYELREHGQVLCGDARVLALVPPFAAAAIPLEDGFRLLLNRMIELIETVCAMPDERAAQLPERVRHSATKLWLDTGTSYLLFQGLYESTYRARGAGLARDLATGLATPIETTRFAAQVAAATRWKLGASAAEPTVTADDLAGQIEDVRALWRWELGRLHAASATGDDRERMRRWMAAQPLAARLRGWASVVKRQGLAASLSRLPRWARQARAGSPRYLVYAAASEFTFALPELLREGFAGAAHLAWAPILRQLPVVRTHDQAGSWRPIGTAIAWNYHRFLEDTRA